MGPAPWDLIRLDLSDIGYIPFHICNICGIFIYFSLVLYSSLFFFSFGKQRIELIVWIDFTFPCSESHCFLGNNSNWTNRECFDLKMHDVSWMLLFFFLFMQSCPENQSNWLVKVFWINSTFTLFTFIYSSTNGWFPQTRFFCDFICVGRSWLLKWS